MSENIVQEPSIGNCGEFFTELLDLLTFFLIEQGLTEQKAGEGAVSMVPKLSETFAGEHLYVSKRPQVFARWMAIYNDLKHMPHTEVDKKYKVSAGYSLKVAKKVEKEKAVKNLGATFIMLDKYIVKHYIEYVATAVVTSFDRLNERRVAVVLMTVFFCPKSAFTSFIWCGGGGSLRACWYSFASLSTPVIIPPYGLTAIVRLT